MPPLNYLEVVVGYLTVTLFNALGQLKFFVFKLLFNLAHSKIKLIFSKSQHHEFFTNTSLFSTVDQYHVLLLQIRKSRLKKFINLPFSIHRYTFFNIILNLAFNNYL